jgi:hypothetical protein
VNESLPRNNLQQLDRPEVLPLFSMSRFVLLYHDCPPDFGRASHWDLMLESGEVLRTWALARLPRAWEALRARTVESCSQCAALGDGDSVEAEELGDHRREYLDYEGDVSGERGRVIRVGAGSYATIEESPDCWRVWLDGVGASNCVCLSRADAGDSGWTLAVGELGSS